MFYIGITTGNSEFFLQSSLHTLFRASAWRSFKTMMRGLRFWSCTAMSWEPSGVGVLSNYLPMHGCSCLVFWKFCCQ